MPQSNLQAGASNWLQNLIKYGTAPFQPGQRLDLLHGGILNPQVPGSLGAGGYDIVGKLFGMTGPEAFREAQKSLGYAMAPATGPAPPEKPPSARPNFVQAAAPTSSPTPFSAAAVAPMMAWVKGQGGTVTSYDRSSQHNKDVGGVRNSYHLTGQAFDSVPPKGTSMGNWRAQLSARFAGWDVLNEGDHVHVEPPKGAPHMAAGPALQAFQSAAAATGLNQPTPSFDQSGYQTADSLLQQVQQNQMRPFSATYQETPMPELPAPEPLQTPDYSAGDAAFAAATPKNPFGATPEEQAKGQLKMRRADYFSGMAQALASIDWSRGVGVGELFAKLGAGALMGAKAGDSEVQARMDKFDEAMQRYQLAVANRDDGKAREAVNIANQNIGQLNNYKRDKWQVQMQEWQKDQPFVQDGVLITKTKNKDGTTTETHTPLDAARQTSALMGRANAAMAAGSAHNEYNWQTYRANRELAGAALPYAMADATTSGNTQGRDGIAAIGLSEAANAVTETGRWSDLYQRYLPNGAAAAASRQREAYVAAGVPVDQNGEPVLGTKIDKDTQTRIDDYLSSKIIEDFVNAGKSWVLVGGETENRDTGERKRNPPSQAALSSLMITRERDRKVRRTTDSKGRTTTSESY